MFLVAHHPVPSSGPAGLAGVFALGLVAGAMLAAKVARGPEAGSVHRAAALSRPSDDGRAAWPRDGNLTARYPAEVIQVIDGDTFEARIHLWPGLDVTTRVRLRGIDAPELKAHCPQEREMAEIAARDPRLAMMDKILNSLANGAKARNNPERLALAQRAYDTRRFALAARLWAEALESDTRLAGDRNTQHAYNAACAASLASANA